MPGSASRPTVPSTDAVCYDRLTSTPAVCGAIMRRCQRAAGWHVHRSRRGRRLAGQGNSDRASAGGRNDLEVAERLADCALTVARLSPLAELLVARLGRDDVDLDRKRLQPPELEAPATGLINDLPAVGRDVAQGVDLIVMLAVGKGRDFGKESLQPRHRIRQLHQAVVEIEQTFAEAAHFEVVGGRTRHGFAGQKVPESLGPEVLVRTPADAVAVHDDDRRLVERVVRACRWLMPRSRVAAP